MSNLVVIAGPQAVGKMTVAENLKEKIGYGRSDWGFNDFEIASKLLEEQAKFIEEKLKGK